jgi:hypothetical protein
MGIVAADTLVWLARQGSNGELELIEVDFATGSAARIFTLPCRSRDAVARLLWSPNERVLYLITHDELIALKRLEA